MLDTRASHILCTGICPDFAVGRVPVQGELLVNPDPGFWGLILSFCAGFLSCGTLSDVDTLATTEVIESPQLAQHNQPTNQPTKCVLREGTTSHERGASNRVA